MRPSGGVTATRNWPHDNLPYDCGFRAIAAREHVKNKDPVIPSQMVLRRTGDKIVIVGIRGRCAKG